LTQRYLRPLRAPLIVRLDPNLVLDVDIGMERARSRRRMMSQRWGRRGVILTPSEKVR